MNALSPRALCLIGVAVVALGCQRDESENLWPCDHSRPCASGFVCQGSVCVPGFGPSSPMAPVPDVVGSTPDIADPSGVDAPPACVPDCPPGACGSDGCGGTCGACPMAVSTGFYVDAVTPRALAFGGPGLWIGDETARVVTVVKPSSGAELATAALPAEGRLVDMAWDDTNSRLIALLDEPSALWGLTIDAEPELLAVTGSATALGIYNDELLTVENGELVRRETGDWEITRKTTLDTTCSLMTVTGGVALMWCGSEGQPGNYVHTLGAFDAIDPVETKALADWAAAVDATEVHGLCVGGGDLWVLGRGYGGDADRVVRMDLP